MEFDGACTGQPLSMGAVEDRKKAACFRYMGVLSFGPVAGVGRAIGNDGSFSDLRPG